jgi:hypothetical protein
MLEHLSGSIDRGGQEIGWRRCSGGGDGGHDPTAGSLDFEIGCPLQSHRELVAPLAAKDEMSMRIDKAWDHGPPVTWEFRDVVVTNRQIAPDSHPGNLSVAYHQRRILDQP